MVDINNNKEKVITKHMRFRVEDQQQLDRIKERFGLFSDSDAIRLAIRNFKGVDWND